MITLMITTLWDSILYLCPSNFMPVVLRDECHCTARDGPTLLVIHHSLYSQPQKYLGLQPRSTTPSYSHAIGGDAGVL